MCASYFHKKTNSVVITPTNFHVPLFHVIISQTKFHIPLYRTKDNLSVEDTLHSYSLPIKNKMAGPKCPGR